jgi:succinyl-diaminopimelate desuccinylase
MADEEMGCEGVRQFVETCHNLGGASAIIIAEPTVNISSIGHNGAIFLKAVNIYQNILLN